VRKPGADEAAHQKPVPRTERMGQVRPARVMTGQLALPQAVYAQSAPRGW
jgi:hypothetical protein